MFSELCRETLRKAAVCYSSGRSSASPSPSPPSSPPPSPSRLPKEVIRAAVETRDVGCNSRGLMAYYDHQQSYRRTSTGPPQEFRDVYRRKRTATPTNVSSRRTSGLESRDGRRLPYAASVDSYYSPPKENQHRQHQHHRRVRSASPEMLRGVVRFSSPESDDNSSGDEAGSAPDDNQRSNSAHNRHRGRDSSANSVSGSQSAREVDRVKLVRDRQNEERQRKLEELRQQALAAQRYREQREEERRRRIEELRCRDTDRRNQVEERKRQIWEAERERREALIQKNHERLARLEAKRKNERSQIVFAFGSSTPRMLEPADTGGMSSSFWGTPRRATSTSNVMTFSATAAPLTRRSSERELDAGSKKRATSAGGLDRKDGDESEMSISGTPAAGCVTRYANRRRTDLMPTIPSPKERSNDGIGAGTPMSGRSSSAKSFTRSPGGRSGEVTPSSPSRPPSSMSQQSGTSSVASSTVNLRPRTAGSGRRPRPASIAGTGVTNYTLDSSKTKDSKPPLPKSVSSVKTPPVKKSDRPASSGGSRSARASPRVTPKPTPLQSPAVEMPPSHIEVKEPTKPPEDKKDHADPKTPQAVLQTLVSQPPTLIEMKIEESNTSEPATTTQEAAVVVQEPARNEPVPSPAAPSEAEKKSPEPEAKTTEAGDLEDADMTASMIQKIRITTEEEAKAALAERRRLAREQAEREAELERQRLEEEARLEVERQRAEEEEQRRLEEETLRLAEEARAAEEARLKQAIEEAERREEEDRKRREEEAKQKAEKEEAERKAREEAEKQRLEMVEKLKKEEEERNARRKRVEAIMSRTRAKNQPNTPNKGEGNDGEKSKEDSPSEESKPNPGDKSSQDLMTTSLISEATQQFISGEQLAAHLNDSSSAVLNGTHANGINDSSSSTTKPLLDNSTQDNGQLNGHHNNGHGNGLNTTQTIALDNATVKQNNVTNNLLDLSEFDTLSNSNNGTIVLMQPTNVVEDSLNSNLNPTAIPFMPNFNTGNINPFQDAFTNNKQQDNQVTDLLS